MKGVMAALRLMTRLPLPVSAQADGIAAALPQLPWSGVAVGVVLAAATAAGGAVDAWLAALLGLCAWIAITGGMHAEGLADLADGLGAAHGDRERLLAVMKEPQIGSFGALALVLLLASKLVLLMLWAKSAADWWPLLLVPVWARFGAVVWVRMLPALTEGMAAALKAGSTEAWPLVWLAGLMLISTVAAPVLLLVPLLLWGWQRFLQHKLGGMNGDAIGAGIECCEVVMLLMLVLYAA